MFLDSCGSETCKAAWFIKVRRGLWSTWLRAYNGCFLMGKWWRSHWFFDGRLCSTKPVVIQQTGRLANLPRIEHTHQGGILLSLFPSAELMGSHIFLHPRWHGLVCCRFPDSSCNHQTKHVTSPIWWIRWSMMSYIHVLVPCDHQRDTHEASKHLSGWLFQKTCPISEVDDGPFY